MRPPVAEPLHPKGWQRPPNNQDFRVTQDFDDVDPVYPSVKHRALDLGDGNIDLDWVVAPEAGVVIAEGFLREPWSQSSNVYGTGNFGGVMCVIRQDDGYTSALAHLSDTIVNVGQRVIRGQAIGHIGDTGAAKGRGSHVHWDVYRAVPRTWAEREAYKVDPWPLLDQNAGLPNTGTATEDAMRFSGSQLHIVDGTPTFKIGSADGSVKAARFRAEATTDSGTIAIFQAGTFVRSAWSVDGQPVGGNDDWLLAAMYVDSAYVTGYFHSSVVQRVPDGNADLQKALDDANRRAAAIKTADAEETSKALAKADELKAVIAAGSERVAKL